MANLFFLTRLLRDPAHIGAVLPSGRQLSRAMARHSAVTSGAIVELGGGTGKVTAALLEGGVATERLVVLERDPQLARHLAARFSGLRVLHGDAQDIRELLATVGVTGVGAFVSSLPLLSLPRPERSRILGECCALLAAGGTFTQFTYGPKPPIEPALERHLGVRGKRAAYALWNVPPATVWQYVRDGAEAARA